MDKKKILAALLVGIGLILIAIPIALKLCGEYEADVAIEQFEERIEADEDKEEEPSSTEKKKDSLLSEDGVIGIIKIKSIGIRYPVFEGTGNAALNAGIGHEPDTAGIGEKGNCVLCGHNGSRHGTFFTTLSQVKIGDMVELTDKKGDVHRYVIAETKVIDPTDISIKVQGDDEILTLFTCANHGTRRFVCICVPKAKGKE